MRPVPSILALLLATSVAPALLAQTPAVPRGRIEGQITDSLQGRPLTGATVYVARVSPDPSLHLATTDDKGRFQVDSLIAGRYAIDFTTPLLDSLDLTLASREVVLAQDERVHVDLGVPSSATLRSAACPGVELPKGKGAVVGRVTNADTDAPLIGASVAVSWIDLSVDRTTLQPVTQQRSGAMPVDSAGNYRLCGVPTDSYLLVQVQDSGRAGSALRIMVSEEVGVTKRDLSLSLGASRSIAEDTSSAATAENAPVRRLTGTATLTGTVRGAAGEPLRDALVSVIDAAGSARTDSSGRFSLSNLPAGTQLVQVRRIGYVLDQLPVELRSARTVDQSITLVRFVSLDSIRVIAQRSRYQDFATRARRSASGRFLTEDDIAKRNANQVSDIVRMLPGFRIVGYGIDAHVVSSRGAISFRQSQCDVNVVIDGMQHQDINLLLPSDIGAMETYSGPGAPMQYDSPCGVIVIWTKR